MAEAAKNKGKGGAKGGKKNTAAAAKKATAKETAEKAAVKETAVPIEETKPETRPEPETEASAPEIQETAVPTQAVQPMVLMPKEPDVKILYMDAVDKTNQIPIGNGRVITGPGKIFNVAMSYFEGEFQNPFRMKLLANRKFIVLSGLTEEQREQYGVNYKEGEIIKKLGMFDFLLGCPTEQAVEVFKNLCPSHRKMVATRFNDAFEKGDNRITRDKIEALNEISKGDYPDGKGAFGRILVAMNESAL